MPPSACSKRPRRMACAPVNAPRSWPKSSLSRRSFGMAAVLIAMKALAGPRAVAVQRARHELLARARLAGDQHGRVRLRKSPDRAEYLLHRARLPEDLGRVAVLRRGLDAPPALLEGPAHQFHRVVDVEGLGQVFERAALEGRHGALEIGVGRHDDHRRRRHPLLEGLHELEPREPGHADVAHHDLGRIVGEEVERLLRRGERAVADALPGKGLLENPADRTVVVDDPDGSRGVVVSFLDHGVAFHCYGRGSPACSGLRTGSRIVKQVRPGALSNSMSPWCWWT